MAKVKLGDVAIEYKATMKKPDDFPIVGLEHLISGEITLKNWSNDSETTFTKAFKEGQMLFGRRRAYLKKAAIAPFDGVCSGDIIVIEAKKDRILPELLPFVIQNDLLFDYAVSKSAGSLSPRVKWSDLKDYEFELPALCQQQKLVDLLQAANETRQAYKEHIKIIDELVKSQFIEMFGDQETNPFGFEKMTLDKVCMFFSGTGFPNEYQGNTSGEYPFYKVGDISKNVQQGNLFLASCDNYISNEIAMKLKGTILPEKTVVFAKIGEALRLNRRAITVSPCLIDNNAMGIQPNEEYLNLEYFFQYMLELDMGKYSATTAMPSVRKSTLQTVEILVPPKNLQKQFSCISKHADKSKFELNKNIEKVDALMKSLMNQDFSN